LPEDIAERVSIGPTTPYTATHAALSGEHLDMLKAELSQAALFAAAALLAGQPKAPLSF